jgi:uncharacterized protein
MNKVFVFDTNTLVSAFMFPNSNPKKAYNLAKTTGLIFVSDITFSELETVFLRPKFDRYVHLTDRKRAIEEYRSAVKFVNHTETITDCRDSKDNKFLELAITANADCLITGDEDLLILNPFRNIPILNAFDFLNQF